MQRGAQINPHKYISRVRNKEGKWIYIYNPSHNTLEELMAGTKEVRVVIAHGNPTALRVGSDSRVVIGPTHLLGRRLMVNRDKSKGYFGRAVDPSGQLPPVYLYPESQAKSVLTKKAAKFAKLDRGLVALNKKAELMMHSKDAETRDYGLVIWLNNNTHMRIGSHADSSSVAPEQRAALIKTARDNLWDPYRKQLELRKATTPTYGLLTLRAGHLNIGTGMSQDVSFRFRGKGGKDNVYEVQLPAVAYNILHAKKFHVSDYDPNKPLFDGISYKKIWRLYKDYGITPHMARGQYADSLVRELMRDFKVTDGESLKKAEKRFLAEIQAKVSDHLNHSRAVTLRHYVSPTTQRALKAFSTQLRARVGTLNESATYDDGLADLVEVLMWRDFGVGNTVI